MSSAAAGSSQTAQFMELVQQQAPTLHQFLAWAADCEKSAPRSSLRIEHRTDVARCRGALHYFREAWWGVAVYSCFDSLIGTAAVAPYFAEPLDASSAEEIIAAIVFPPSSVQGHRAQATLKRAKMAMASICNHAVELKEILSVRGATFEERFDTLSALGIAGWKRTTNFDCLLRAGLITEVGGGLYRPGLAHLNGSTGPRNGFYQIWGIAVDDSNESRCEELLHLWTSNWHEIAAYVGVEWNASPFDSADLENALCIFQERPKRDFPNPAHYP